MSRANTKERKMLHVYLESVKENTDGTVDAVVHCDETRLQVTGLAWLDDDADNDYMLALFEEWHTLALEGEEGYTILT